MPWDDDTSEYVKRDYQSYDLDDERQLRYERLEEIVQRAWDWREQIVKESLKFERGSIASEAYVGIVHSLDFILDGWTPSE